jgi:hypothetical protein
MTDLTPRPDAVPPLAPGRSCEGCTTCCKLLSIDELKKPAQTWCQHCEIGVGCKIYSERPDDCRTFYCGWVLDGAIGDEWDPRRSKMVIKFEDNWCGRGWKAFLCSLTAKRGWVGRRSRNNAQTYCSAFSSDMLRRTLNTPAAAS